MDSRIADLEIRLTHQEAALEELTRVSLRQQAIINEMQARLENIQDLLQDLSPSADVTKTEIPPHY